MKKTTALLILGILLASVAAIRWGTRESASLAADSQSPASTVFVSVVSDPVENPQAVDMAIKFAGFALDEKRKVVVFFTVKGVRVPVKSLSEKLAFGDHSPIKSQLAELIKRGAEVHVCPVCMKGLNIKDADIVSGAQVTTRPKLFSHIHAETSVFTF